jgi:hypothetical protein
MASQALNDALKDAGVKYHDVKAAVCGYCYGDPTSGNTDFVYINVPLFEIVRLPLHFPRTRAALRVPRRPHWYSNRQYQQQLQHRGTASIQTLDNLPAFDRRFSVWSSRPLSTWHAPWLPREVFPALPRYVFT